jgi:hypothetical protein
MNRLRNFKIVISALVLLFLWNINGLGQDCSNTFKKCKNPDKSYKISASSRSIKMRKGRKSRIVLTAYQGREYYFSTYADRKAGKLQFRIVDSQSNKVLYDNSTEGLIGEKVFTTDNTTKLFIELFSPNWTSNNKIECVAFKIAYRKR